MLAVLPSVAQATPIDGLVVSEILFNPRGNDNRKEWIELYNRSGSAIDLSNYSLGWGRDSYTDGSYVFSSFLLAPGATFVIGGPTTNSNNGDPVYDQVLNFAPNLRNGTNNNSAASIGLFLGDIGTDPTLVPVHAVIYGESTATSSVLDEQNTTATVLFNTDGFVEGNSVEWTGGETWQVSASLGPGIAPAPEPGTALLVGVGLVTLGLVGRARRALVHAPSA